MVSTSWLFDVNAMTAAESKFLVSWTDGKPLCGAITWVFEATIVSSNLDASSYMTLTSATSPSELAIDLSSRVSTADEEAINIVVKM